MGAACVLPTRLVCWSGTRTRRKAAMPEALNLSTEELAQTPMGCALLAGKLVASVMGSTGHVTVKAMCKAKVDGRWRTVEFTEATHVFLSVPAADGGFADKIGTYYPQGKHTGMLWSDRTADACRIKAAVYMLNAAAGRNAGTHVLQGTYCYRCGKELTEPESIKLGFGPTCLPHAQSQHAPKVKGGDGTGDGLPVEHNPADALHDELIEGARIREQELLHPMGDVKFDRSPEEIAQDATPTLTLLRKGDSAQLALEGLGA